MSAIRRRANDDGVLWGAVADMMTLVSAVFLIVFLVAMMSYRKAETDRADTEKKYQTLVEGARSRRKAAEHALTASAQGGIGILSDNKIKLPEQLLFPTGSAELTTSGEATVRAWLAPAVAAVVAIPGQRVLIGGHTDAQPISLLLQRRFATNWELSAHRATNVLRAVLGAEPNLPPGSVYAAGFADTILLIPGKPFDGQNRRVEVEVKSEDEAIVGG